MEDYNKYIKYKNKYLKLKKDIRYKNKHLKLKGGGFIETIQDFFKFIKKLLGLPSEPVDAEQMAAEQMLAEQMPAEQMPAEQADEAIEMLIRITIIDDDGIDIYGNSKKEITVLDNTRIAESIRDFIPEINKTIGWELKKSKGVTVINSQSPDSITFKQRDILKNTSLFLIINRLKDFKKLPR